MDAISIILKNDMLVSVDEFRIIDRYATYGRLWHMIERHKAPTMTVRQRKIEYIFEPEALTMFGIVSRNILATWKTEITQNTGPYDEFEIMHCVFIRPLSVDTYIK